MAKATSTHFKETNHSSSVKQPKVNTSKASQREQIGKGHLKSVSQKRAMVERDRILLEVRQPSCRRSVAKSSNHKCSG